MYSSELDLYGKYHGNQLNESYSHISDGYTVDGSELAACPLPIMFKSISIQDLDAFTNLKPGDAAPSNCELLSR